MNRAPRNGWVRRSIVHRGHSQLNDLHLPRSPTTDRPFYPPRGGEEVSHLCLCAQNSVELAVYYNVRCRTFGARPAETCLRCSPASPAFARTRLQCDRRSFYSLSPGAGRIHDSQFGTVGARLWSLSACFNFLDLYFLYPLSSLLALPAWPWPWRCCSKPCIFAYLRLPCWPGVGLQVNLRDRVTRIKVVRCSYPSAQ